MRHKGTVFESVFQSWPLSVGPLLEKAGLIGALVGHDKILIKPNLVEPLAPPITTPVGLVEALVDFLQDKVPACEILIGEGTGSNEHETPYVFEKLGYCEMAARKGVRLLDLNEQPLISKSLPQCRRWPQMHLPQIVYDSFLLSVPVLKAHSLASVTLTMKNMMGCAPPSYYRKGGHWKKSSFHDNVQAAVLDLNRYRTPDFTLLDATVGMQEAHLWGPVCDPPPNKLAASHDSVAIDVYGAGLLKRDWKMIGYLFQAHGELGQGEPLEIVESE
ncbi:MAG: DUF362 domain-containing protein [Proteobacteria bacterium]|nr:DUF362 domain-containing protein [Pseudomonadota bacterium]MBU1715965.1 DUF362 domain-containing protein [Pseudomonadota bacterium]